MKTFLYTLIAFTFTLSSVAQNTNPDKYTLKNSKIFVEKFDSEGNLTEKGSFLKTGELDGKWISYRADGKIKSIGFYKAGTKVGNWTHYDNFTNEVHNVSYDNNSIASIESSDFTAYAKE